MSAKILTRAIRRRMNTAVVWAMVPLAAISGQSVAGCMSADGQLDPNCRCWINELHTGAGCHCHCSCCGTPNCCCKNKSHTSNSLASHPSRPGGEGITSNGHCHPFAIFLGVKAVRGSQQSSLDRASLNALNPLVADVGARLDSTCGRPIPELATGPPPDNLVVELHRWII
jgi:hypothetical protein